MFLFDLNGWFVRFLENYVYALPEPPQRERTKPMQVICVGLPRTGTESLQHALLMLGYDHTFHGWDINYEEPNYSPQWVRLCRKKSIPSSPFFEFPLTTCINQSLTSISE